MMSATDPFFDEADLNEERFRCKHGTFTGNPYGADYLCGYCEDGVTEAEYLEILRAREINRLRGKCKVALISFGVLIGAAQDEELASELFARYRLVDGLDEDIILAWAEAITRAWN